MPQWKQWPSVLSHTAALTAAGIGGRDGMGSTVVKGASQGLPVFAIAIFPLSEKEATRNDILRVALDSLAVEESCQKVIQEGGYRIEPALRGFQV